MKKIDANKHWPKFMEVDEEIDLYCEKGKLVIKSTTKDRIFKITTNLEHLPSERV